MSSVNPAPIQTPNSQIAPATKGATPPSPDLVDAAIAADDCRNMFLNAFSESLFGATQVEGDAAELVAASVTYEKGTSVEQQGTSVEQQGTSVEQQGTSVEQQGTSVEQQGTTVEEQAKTKETTNTDIEDKLRTQRAVALKAGMDDSEGAPAKTYVANIVDGQFKLKSTANMTKQELEEARTIDTVVFKHDNILGLSPALCATLGFRDGQKISYIDEDGKKHTVTIHRFDEHEMNHFSNIVSVCLSQISEDTREEASRSKEEGISKARTKPPLTANHTVSVLNRNDRRDEKDSIEQNKGIQNGATQVSQQVAELENLITENVRDRLHDAHELSEFIEKLINIIVSDYQKFDISSQSLKLDNLKKEHTFIVLPRSILAH